MRTIVTVIALACTTLAAADEAATVGFWWPYYLGGVAPGEGVEHAFTLQVGVDAEMADLRADVPGLTVNYHALPAPEPGEHRWFWRVGYDVGTAAERWTGVYERRFAVATTQEGGRTVTEHMDAAPPKGEVVWQADLADTSGWVGDGELTAEHLEGGVLRINNLTRSVYWADRVIEAPVLLDMQVRTEDEDCRAILFFMADGVGGRDIFEWQRPAADYGDYAYENTMRLYTVGMMREGCGTENNFRFLGGELPEQFQILRVPGPELTAEQRPLYRKAFEDFQPYSIPSTTQDGYVVGQWQRYQVLVDAALIRVWADGRLLHEVVDHEPIARGRVGFRNFKTGTSIEVRSLRALQPAP